MKAYIRMLVFLHAPELNLRQSTNTSCCLLTLEPKETAPIEIAYIIPPATPYEQLDILRVAWNTPSRPQVNAAINLINILCCWHGDFDLGRWALFPTVDLLNDVVQTERVNASIRCFPDDKREIIDLYRKFSTWHDQRQFNYRLAWIHDVPNRPIVRKGYTSNPVANDSPPGEPGVDGVARQSSTTTYQELVERPSPMAPVHNQSGDSADDTPLSSLCQTLFDDCKAYQYPYPNFPLLRSHVHPLFVVENAGQKIHTLSSDALQKLGPEAKIIDQLYRRWHGIPFRINTSATFKKRYGDRGDNDGASKGTSRHNSEGHDLKVSQASEASDSPIGLATQGKLVTRPHNAFDMMYIDSSADTPSLSHDGPTSSNQDSDSSKMKDDVHHYNSLQEWAAACTMDHTVEVTNDHQLGTDDEAPRPPRPQLWERWAESPPKMPVQISDRYDTSRLTSYHWSLYHRRVNLLAPYGSHKVPESHFIPWVRGEYDPYAHTSAHCLA